MMNNTHILVLRAVSGQEHLPALADLDLTPEGLADAPARQMDLESLVHTGNS